MTGRVEGKVAFITGAARGQGRSHAVRLAEEGADIVAVDILENIATAAYSMSTPEGMAETVKLVEALDRRIVPIKAEVREPGQMRDAATEAIAAFGHIEIVSASAGILSFEEEGFAPFSDVFGVDFLGVVNTVDAVAPHLRNGASIIITASTAAMIDNTVDKIGPGGMAYTSAKRAVSRYAHDIARVFVSRRIRVNVVHPFNTNTTLIQNDLMYQRFRPDLENPTREDALGSFASTSPTGVPWIEPRDVSNAVLVLASDEAMFITGLQLKVDTGQLLAITTAGVPG